MTRLEQAAKNQIEDKLGRQGYPTYARLFHYFDLHLTKDPDVIGYMIPSKGVITLNAGLDIDQVSTVVRHEILHEYLDHQLRLMQHLGDRPEDHTLANIAMDYEISNRGYTPDDKRIIRSILLNGEILQGLVTEDDHPEWLAWDMEDMYDALEKEREKVPPENPDEPPIDDKDFDLGPDRKISWGGGGGGQGGQSSSSAGVTIVKGTFKDGQFYDQNGKLVTHE